MAKKIFKKKYNDESINLLDDESWQSFLNENEMNNFLASDNLNNNLINN